MERTAARWLLVLSLCCCALAAVAADEGYAGTEQCAICHEDLVSAMAASPHAFAPGWNDEQSCESCHGPGAEHVESGGEADKIQRFSELTPKEASDACLSCHKRQKSHFSFVQSIHRLGDVGCNDCHNPHATTEKLLKAQGAELCSSCHASIAMQFELPRSHPIAECAECHEPHATKALRTSKSLFEETCGNCHFEKKGPFLFGHDVLQIDGCAACHEVHGSPNRHLLKHEPQVNLCYQCHSASVTPPWHSVPRFLNEKCTACHTAIHGSNTSPYFLEE